MLSLIQMCPAVDAIKGVAAKYISSVEPNIRHSKLIEEYFLYRRTEIEEIPQLLVI